VTALVSLDPLFTGERHGQSRAVYPPISPTQGSCEAAYLHIDFRQYLAPLGPPCLA